MPEGNQLYPIFLKLENLNILIVGGGYVGTEKLTALLNNCPTTSVTVLAPEIREDILELHNNHPSVTLVYKEFSSDVLDAFDIIIAGTANHDLNIEIHREAKKKGKIVNVADTPDLCDFYMCSIVKKGDLKIGISTNGKSPTLSKRIRELLEDVLPEDIQELMDNLLEIRNSLKGDFEYKVKKLNEITASMKPDTKK